MKIFKLTVVVLLVSITSVFAQEGNPNMSDNWITSDLTKTVVETENNSSYITKQLEITKEYTPVKLDPRDKYQLNQDIIYMPTQVYKNIKLDYNKDSSFEKEIEFEYEKSENFDLNFTLAKDGIIVTTDKKDVFISKIWNKNSKNTFSNVKNNRINKEGTYSVMFSNNEKVDITITNYEIF